jgi:RNA polymerase subunit RPABC4/transcription elongation factor Spt4
MNYPSKYHLNSKIVRKKLVCPACGKNTFNPYLNTDGDMLHPTSGRCDRENNCGYHLTPREFFLQGGSGIGAGEWKSWSRTAKTDYIPEVIVRKSLAGFRNSNLYRFFFRRYGLDVSDKVFLEYRVGSCRSIPFGTVFWQTDRQGMVRSGKIMGYNSDTGRRVHGAISWAHKELGLDGYCLKQCLFGEHLVGEWNGEIGVVESEKTAMIMRIERPDIFWLASGGSHGIGQDKMSVLEGRKVLLMPDNGMYDIWKEKSRALRRMMRVKVSDYCEKNLKKGEDIADFYLCN